MNTLEISSAQLILYGIVYCGTYSSYWKELVWCIRVPFEGCSNSIWIGIHLDANTHHSKTEYNTIVVKRPLEVYSLMVHKREGVGEEAEFLAHSWCCTITCNGYWSISCNLKILNTTRIGPIPDSWR